MDFRPGHPSPNGVMMTTSTIENPVLSTATGVRPMTGDEYMASLRDGREVYFRGERVADVTTHPAFRNSVRSIARMYAALHAPGARGLLAVPTDTGNGDFTHPFFQDRKQRRRPGSRPGTRSRSRNARSTAGWDARPTTRPRSSAPSAPTPTSTASTGKNALHWYKQSQERVLYLNHAIVNPPIDRDKPADETADVCVHVVERRRDRHAVRQSAVEPVR